MPIVRLTEAAWVKHEAERVRGILLCHLGREGKPVEELIAFLLDRGLRYTGPELVLIRDRLIADGVIEIV